MFSDPCDSEEYNTSREHERRKTQKRRPEGGIQMKIHDASFRSIKPSSLADRTRRPLKQEQKRKATGPQQEVSVARNLFFLKKNLGHVCN